MRINLGCGLVYKRGYVNVDAYDTTVADRVMSAWHLDFDDNVASLIECSQVLEHLGAATSLYALAECYRVLQPGGTLVLDTPDIESAFRTFLKRGEDERRYLLTWIYGLDMPGLVHRFGFPRDLLHETLQQIGFTQTRSTRWGTGTIQPSLRATCKKPQDCLPHQTMAWTRRSLLDECIVNLDDQVMTLSQETLLQNLTSYALQQRHGFDKSLLNKVIADTAVHDPRVTLAFLKSCTRGNLLPANEIADQLRVLKKLEALDFPSILLHLLRQLQLEIGTQQQAFSSVCNLGSRTIAKMLTVHDQSKVLREIHQTRNELGEAGRLQVFSEVAVEQLAQRLFAQGAKAFGLQRFADATALFEDALRLDRDHLLVTWNLARLKRLQGNLPESAHYYEEIQQLAQRYKQPHRRAILSRLRVELGQQSRQEDNALAAPIFSAL